MEKASIEPALQVRFSTDFTVVQVEGDLEDHSTFGVTALTAVRTVEQGAQALGFGKPEIIRGRNLTSGFSLHLDDSGHNLKRYEGICRWQDFDPSAVNDSAGVYPVLPQTNDIPGWIDQIPGLNARGLRLQATDEWAFQIADAEVSEEAFSTFALSILQLDLLFKSIGLPRRELQLQFTNHQVSLASNEDMDFLLATTNRNLVSSAQATLNRCMNYFAWPI
ncbi:MAG: hypothetical protein AAFX93_17935 [Verrucomicrobiota bacterium]